MCYTVGMEQRDGRSLDHRTLEHLRRLAVRRVAEGERPREVMRSLGFCRTSIYKWLRAYRRRGEAGLAGSKSNGPTPKLTDAQKRQVREWIVGKDPRQWGFDFGLWTRQVVQQMILDKFRVSLTLPSVGHLLTSLQITPQKPLRRAYERDEAAVTKWKMETYPALRRRALKNGAEMFFLDEAGVRSDSALGRSYGLRGRTPVVKTSGKRQSINAISAVNPKGAFWYNVYPGRLNGASFIQFLRDFMKRRRKPVYMVLDSLPAHKTKAVRAYVASTQGKLELHFLPTYAPDTNPDEFVWNHLKQNGTSKKPLRADESLKHRVIADLSAIQSDPALVRTFFMAESVAYTIY